MKNRHVFTLIELLVVISIVSLLMAILLPALKKARQRAQDIQCLTNLRQLSFVHAAYRVDYDNYFAPASAPLSSGDAAHWPYRLIPYMQDNRDLYRCPRQPGGSSNTGYNGNFKDSYMLYGMNIHFGYDATVGYPFNAHKTDYLREDDWPKIASIPFLTDVQSNTNPANGIGPMVTNWHSATGGNGLAGLKRHDDLIHIAYSDGHVSVKKKALFDGVNSTTKLSVHHKVWRVYDTQW